MQARIVQFTEQMEPLIAESNELIAILTTIIKKSRD
jgi:hypothetical protein